MISMTKEQEKRSQQAAGQTKLRRLRDELGVSQEALARRMRTTSLRTYARAEGGKQQVRYDTAQEILEALNAIRAEQGKGSLVLEDLELRIY